jgi:hypothetical protein
MERSNGAAYGFDSFDQADLNDNALGREEMMAEYLRVSPPANRGSSHADKKPGSSARFLQWYQDDSATS